MDQLGKLKIPPHLFSKHIGEIMETFSKYGHTQQLRERIVKVINKHVVPEHKGERLMKKMVRCLVKKENGDFERAAKLGYGVNVYCAEGYMWLHRNIEEGNIGFVKTLIQNDGFEMISEVEYA
ncbi:hypothetical protein [Escherichia phage UPEC06]|nr:hypothetical protein [Escherichia phage UPEC06]